MALQTQGATILDLNTPITADELVGFPEPLRPYAEPGRAIAAGWDGEHRASEPDNPVSLHNHPDCAAGWVINQLRAMIERADVPEALKPELMALMMLESIALDYILLMRRIQRVSEIVTNVIRTSPPKSPTDAASPAPDRAPGFQAPKTGQT